MIVELGHFSLVLALGLAALTGLFGLLGAARSNHTMMNTLGVYVSGQLVFLLLSFCALAYAFLTDDFSVAYVAANSNTLLPQVYKFSALWGAHEGSFLLWCLIMVVWTFAVAVKTHHLPMVFRARVLGVMGLLSVGFLCFLLFTSNPFERLVPLTPAEGADLNPLLQDFGLIVHPPMLYTGYVGFSVAFAFAIAALLSGRLDTTWARWSRPWTNMAWSFLTVGIALGSWWAYYELGWGGWWFWDPVENASFMPWLVGTALIHCLAVTEKRGAFKAWTVLLAISAFSLSLLGAFIVRSGVLTSVHSFAVDPTRGLYILIFLGLIVGGSLTLYALRANVVRSRISFLFASKEAFLLVNNIILVICMCIVLFGTLAPLAYEAWTGGSKISVGPPYFNAGFVPAMLVLGVALAMVPAMNWKSTPWVKFRKTLLQAVIVSLLLLLAALVIAAKTVHWSTPFVVGLGIWIVCSHLLDLLARLGLRGPNKTQGLRRVPLGYWGMTIAHCGFAAALLGVALTTEYSVEKDLRVTPGQMIELGGYQFEYAGISQVQGPNYRAEQGSFRVLQDGEPVAVLTPEKRFYSARQNVMTEAGIDAGFWRDIYISMGERLQGEDWAVRIQVKPFVRWIWLGCILMGLGGVIAMGDARYRRLRKRGVALNVGDAYAQ